MGTDDTERESHDSQTQDIGELEFLMYRYDQLIEDQIHTNQIIHSTFYISIVVFGALLGGIPQLENIFARVVLYGFSATIFLAMFGWTKTYLNTRSENEKRQNDVLEAVRAIDRPYTEIDSVGAFFSDPDDYRRDKWEQDWRKEIILQVYYVALAVISLLVLLVDAGVWAYARFGL